MAIEEKASEEENVFPFFEGEGEERTNYQYIALEDLCIKPRTKKIGGKEVLIEFKVRPPTENNEGYQFVKKGAVVYASADLLRTIPRQSGSYTIFVTGYQERKLSLNLE